MLKMLRVKGAHQQACIYFLGSKKHARTANWCTNKTLNCQD